MLDRYTAELRSPALPLAYSARNKDVKRVQEWLTLQGFATGIAMTSAPPRAPP